MPFSARATTKGRAQKGSPGGNARMGGFWGNGKGAYYCEDDNWNTWTPQWTPQQLLSLRKAVPEVPQASVASACPRTIVPGVDSERFSVPKKPSTKKASGRQTQVETRNSFSHLPDNEDIPINICVGEPYPALTVHAQEAKTAGRPKTAPAVVSPSVPQACAASACSGSLQEGISSSNENQYQYKRLLILI